MQQLVSATPSGVSDALLQDPESSGHTLAKTGGAGAEVAATRPFSVPLRSGSLPSLARVAALRRREDAATR